MRQRPFPRRASHLCAHRRADGLLAPFVPSLKSCGQALARALSLTGTVTVGVAATTSAQSDQKGTGMKPPQRCMQVWPASPSRALLGSAWRPRAPQHPHAPCSLLFRGAGWCSAPAAVLTSARRRLAWPRDCAAHRQAASSITPPSTAVSPPAGPPVPLCAAHRARCAGRRPGDTTPLDLSACTAPLCLFLLPCPGTPVVVRVGGRGLLASRGCVQPPQYPAFVRPVRVPYSAVCSSLITEPVRTGLPCQHTR